MDYKEYHRQYYQLNRQIRLDYQKEYNKSHKQQYKEYQHNYYIQKRKNPNSKTYYTHTLTEYKKVLSNIKFTIFF